MTAMPEPLVLYTLVAKSRVEQCIASNTLPLERWQWHIGFRQEVGESLARQCEFDGHVDKDSHMVLRVTFSPLGVAHFVTTVGDKANQFLPVLHKVRCGWPTDRGQWRFIQDLPLSLSTALGQDLVSSEWLEIE